MIPAPSKTKKIPALDTLLQVLARMEKLHRDLIAEAENKRAAIVEGDLVRLEGIIGRERLLVADVEKEETLRRTTVRIARRAFQLDGPVGKLAELIDVAPEPYAASLTTARDQLRAVIEELHQKTRLNQALLKASMDHVQGFLRTLREATGAQTVYNARAQTAQTGGRAFMDTNA